MTIEQAKDYMHDHATDILEKDKDGHGYVCPICNSGAGKNGTGIKVKSDGVHFTCFAGNCFTNADIVDILAIRDGIDVNANFVEKIKNATRYFNISIDDEPTERPATIRTATEPKKDEPPKPRTDYTEQYKQWHKDIVKTDYLQRRGISDETINRFYIGYDERHDAIVIPVDKWHYKSRGTKSKTWYATKDAEITLFNQKAVDTDKDYIYITEAEIDALSIEETGNPAIAICGTGNAELVKGITHKLKHKTVLLYLDADAPGDKATATIEDILNNASVDYVDIRPLFADFTQTLDDGTTAPVKDANDMLRNYPVPFKTLLNDTTTAEKRRHAYKLRYSVKPHIKDFINGISEYANTPPTRTGFKTLDAVFNGGLRMGMYTFGADTGTGKTTFLLQVADYIAKNGHDVILFALEMAEPELMAKSISRETFLYCIDNDVPANPNAQSSINITDGTKYNDRIDDNGNVIKGYTDLQKQVIAEAINRYAEYCGNMRIVENNGHITIADVERITDDHVKQTGNAPVVILDYLQLLAPPQERLTDKQCIDINTTRLKALSQRHKTPVIVVSSLNREKGKEQPFTEGALNGSGNIEFTSNVVMGLQLKGIENDKGYPNDKFNKYEATKRNPQKIELKITKQRHGVRNAKILFDFYPQFSYFEEADENE